MSFCIKKVIYLIVLIGYSFSYAGSYEDYFLAIDRDTPRDVKLLLDRGFDPNTVNANGQYSLMLALSGGAWDVAKVLISHPATHVNVRNSRDETPLMLAALKGQLDLCQALIDREADINKTGWTPLHYAATSGNPGVIQLMLEHHAYVDAESPNSTTPLMMAALYGGIEAVKLLLDAGADASLKNLLGLSALDFARKAKNPGTVELIATALRGMKPQGSW